MGIITRQYVEADVKSFTIDEQVKKVAKTQAQMEKLEDFKQRTLQANNRTRVPVLLETDRPRADGTRSYT